MNKILVFLYIFLQFISSTFATKGFDYIPTLRKSYKFSGKGSKLLASLKDSDGNVFTVLSTTNSAVNYSNGSHQNYKETISKKQEGTTITLSKINVQQRIEWTDTLTTHATSGVTFDSLDISPQGNIALCLTISSPLKGPKGKSWIPEKSDALFLFLENSDGSLIKDIQLTGRENESRAKVYYGTGGEVFLRAKSNSPQLKYLNQSYPFKYPDKDVFKDFVVSLKSNYFTNWSRSIEPDSLEDMKVYKDNLAVMAFNYSTSFGIYKKNGFIKHYKKPEKTPLRSAVYAFNKEGYKNWDQVCHGSKKLCSILNLKVYPNGNIGVHGQFDETVTFGSATKLTEIPLAPKEDGADYYLLSLDQEGSKVNEMIFNSKPSLDIHDNGDNHTLITFGISRKNLDKPIHYKSTTSGSGTVTYAYQKSCADHIILDQNLSYSYYEQGGLCFKGKYNWLRLSQGKIKSLTGGMSLQYIEVPYGEDKDNDEDIPGLAFKPKFFHGESKSSSSVVLSYAIPPQATEAIVYYPPKGVTQTEYLSNSLVQATLNSTYFRGFAVLVLTSKSDLVTEMLTKTFNPLMKKEFFNDIEKWNIVGYEDRALDLINIYNKNILTRENPYLVAKSMALYYPEIKDTLIDKEEERADMAAKMPASFIVSGKHDLEVRKRMRELQQTFLEYGTDFSHMHFDGAPLTKRSFSALNSYGEVKSTEIYEKIVKSGCIDNKKYLNRDPREKGFIENCVKGGLPLSAQEKSEKKAQSDFIQHMEVHYGYKGHTPFLDQEYFEFIGYIKENHVVAKKKRQGDLNSVLK